MLIPLMPMEAAAAGSDLAILTSTLSDGQVGVSYSDTVDADGGTAPYAFSIVSGALPSGLSLNASTGVISGTPTLAETASFTVRVTDTLSDTDDQALSIDVAAAVLAITTTSLPPGFLTSPYNSTIASIGGTAPYTYAVTVGSLPNGLSLNASTGAITGTPTVQATFNFTVTVTDNVSATDTQAYTVTIYTLPSGQSPRQSRHRASYRATDKKR